MEVDTTVNVLGLLGAAGLWTLLGPIGGPGVLLLGVVALVL